MLEAIRTLAIEKYCVDPGVYLILYLITVPIYYFGLYLMVERGIKIYKDDKKTKRMFGLNQLFSDHVFLIGLITNLIASLIPYFYIVFWGDNIPLWFHAYTVGFFLVGTYYLFKRAHLKIAVRSTL